jgi:hypothetical protein
MGAPAKLDPFSWQQWQTVNSNRPTIYLRAEDQVRLSTFSTSAGLTVTLNAIVLDLAGTTRTFQMSVTTDATGNRVSTRQRWGEGYLLYCYPTLSGGTPAAGVVQVTVELLQGDQSTGPILYQLLNGTLTANGLIPFADVVNSVTVSGSVTATPPQPTIVTTALANPGAGADWTTTVTAAQVWELQSIRATLVASAAAANRQARFTIDDGTNILFRTESTLVVTANGNFSFNAFNGAAIFTPADATNYQMPLPRILLGAGYRISSSTLNIQAGDQWSGVVVNYRLYA